jgi:hypothetical protein
MTSRQQLEAMAASRDRGAIARVDDAHGFADAKFLAHGESHRVQRIGAVAAKTSNPRLAGSGQCRFAFALRQAGDRRETVRNDRGIAPCREIGERGLDIFVSDLGNNDVLLLAGASWLIYEGISWFPSSLAGWTDLDWRRGASSRLRVVCYVADRLFGAGAGNQKIKFRGCTASAVPRVHRAGVGVALCRVEGARRGLSGV